MRSPVLLLGRAAVALGVAGALLLSVSLADDVKGPIPQKPLDGGLLTDLVGTWATQSTATHDGKEVKGHATVKFEKGIGGTALLETYEAQMPGPDGNPMDFHGHGVYKASEDGKVTLWWFCNLSPDVTKLTGTATDGSMELSGDSPTGGRMTISMQKSGDGYSFKLSEGANTMTEAYTRSR